MSTNYNDLEHLGILLTRFAGPSDEGEDRFRLQLTLTRPYAVLTRDVAIHVGKVLIALANGGLQCTLPAGHPDPCMHDPAATAGGECDKVVISRAILVRCLPKEE